MSKSSEVMEDENLFIAIEYFNFFSAMYKGVRKGLGGSGLNPPFELDILQNFITCVKGINCYRILFGCEFVDLMQIPRNQFACKFQGTL